MTTGFRIHLTGQRFGRWLVLGRADGALWVCRCDCGSERPVRSQSLRSGKSVSCGCVKPRSRGARIEGLRFGRLLVLKDPVGDWTKDRKCLCLCDCGSTKEIFVRSLTRDLTKSCGCMAREMVRAAHTTHGKAGTLEYRCWHAIIARCRNPNATGYAGYGGRGIKVCDRWQIFENFLEDMGPRPTLNHSIDRIDGAKGYFPENCRWATSREQSRNRNNNAIIEFQGVRRALVDWCELLGLKQTTVRTRRRRGETDPGRLFAPTGMRSHG